MLNWKEQFVAKKTALINRNGEYESPKRKIVCTNIDDNCMKSKLQ